MSKDCPEVEAYGPVLQKATFRCDPVIKPYIARRRSSGKISPGHGAECFGPAGFISCTMRSGAEAVRAWAIRLCWMGRPESSSEILLASDSSMSNLAKRKPSKAVRKQRGAFH